MKLIPPRIATLTMPIKGHFTKFKMGERVKVVFMEGNRATVEREVWEGELPLMNQCAHVPVRILKFEK